MIRTSSIVLSLRTKLADFDAVDIGQHHVEHDQVGAELLDQHAGAEAVVDAADVEAAVALQLIDDQFDQIFIVVDDEDLALAAIEGVGRNAVVAHERVELIARNAAEPAARNAEALQLARVEAANDRLLTDLANLGGFAGRENSFHALNHPSP